jgi:pyridoxine kinase
MNILSIQSEVAYGHVGNAAARFALQRLGHEVWALPTVMLSSHAGHPGLAGEATTPALLAKLIDAPAAQGRLAACDGVISGYLGSPEQAELIADAVRRTRAANPKVRYCLDPAFGDDGRVYARPGVAEALAESLLPLADIVTPNAFELSVLAGLPVGDPDAAWVAAAQLARPIVVGKSVPLGERLGTLLLAGSSAWLASTPRLVQPPRGAGDLFAALLTGQFLAGRAPETALELAVRATYHVLAQSEGRDEMQLIAEQQALITPPALPAFRLEPLGSGRRAHG